MNWLSQAIHAIEGGSGSTPTPLKLGPTPGNFGAPTVNSPSLPAGSDASNLQAFQAAAMNSPDLAGVLQGIENAGGDIGGAIEKVVNGLGGWQAIGKDVAGFIKNNASTILSGLSAYNAYENQQKANQLGNQAVNDAKAQYATQAPLRSAGMAGMLNPSANTPDLTRLGTMATAGQGLQAPQPIPLGQNRANITATAGVGNPFAPKAIPMAGGPTPPNVPSAPPTAQPPAVPMAPPSPYVPSKFGAQPIPLAPTPGAPTAAPRLTPQVPNVGGPVPPRLTIPLGAQ